ncbi:MAG: hypothetical protein PVJ67_05790 [Candidatus Pacearchaeota archaeon]|jgi:hypothetical protein
MKDITRIVVDANDSQVLTFEKGRLGSTLSYDYHNRRRFTKTKAIFNKARLVKEKVNHERINSAISFGEGVYFLLRNFDHFKGGNNYHGFMKTKKLFLNKLESDVDLDNSFFLNIYNSSLNSKKKSTEYLVLDNTYVGGYASLHELLGAGGYNARGDESFKDLIWSEEKKSFLVLREWVNLDSNEGIKVSNDSYEKYLELKEKVGQGEKAIQVTDCNGLFINGCLQSGPLFIQTNISHPSSGIIGMLEVSKSYEEVFGK